MKIVAVVNQKGGVAKTTTTANLASCLVALGKKVLMIDMDPQGNLTKAFGITTYNDTIYDCLRLENYNMSEAIYSTNIGFLNIIPANIRLSNAEIELSSVFGRESLLNEAFANAINDLDYDYCFIDCNPALGLLTVNSLVACDEVIIPLDAGIFALEGISDLVKTITMIKKKFNVKLNILGVLLTKVDSRTNLAKEILDEIKNTFGERTFKTLIHQNTAIGQAQKERKPINIFDAKSKGAIEYMALAKEVLSRG